MINDRIYDKLPNIKFINYRFISYTHIGFTMASISQTVITPQTEFTFHFYKIQSFSNSTKESRFHFQKRVQSETLSLDAFLNLLTGKKAFLYTRTVIYVGALELGRINIDSEMGDLRYFLEAMYHMVPGKILPESSHLTEKESKKVDFAKATTLLNTLIPLFAKPEFAKHTQLQALVNYFVGYLCTYGIGYSKDLEIATKFYDNAITLDYVEAHTLKALLELEKENFIPNIELYESKAKMDALKKKLGPNSNMVIWLFNRSTSASLGFHTASKNGSLLSLQELAHHYTGAMVAQHLDYAVANYALAIENGATNLIPRHAYYKHYYCKVKTTDKNTLKKELIKLINILERAAKAGTPETYLYLGHLYRDGAGVTQSNPKALDYYYRAADHHFSEAYPAIIRLKTKCSTPADIKEAIRLFGKWMRVNQKELQIQEETKLKIEFKTRLTKTLMATLYVFTEEDYSTSIQDLQKAILKYNIEPGVEIPKTLAEAKTKLRRQDHLWDRLSPEAQMPISRLFDQIGPLRKAQIMDFCLPLLADFKRHVSLFKDTSNNKLSADNLFEFLKTKIPGFGTMEREKPLLLILSSLSVSEFLALRRLLNDQDIIEEYIDAVTLYKWEDKDAIRQVHQSLILRQLRFARVTELDCESILPGQPQISSELRLLASEGIQRMMYQVESFNKQIRKSNSFIEMIWLAVDRSYLNKNYLASKKIGYLTLTDYQEILMYFYTNSSNLIQNMPHLKEKCRIELSALPLSQAIDILEGICSLGLSITPFKEVFLTAIKGKVGVKFERNLEPKMNQLQRMMEELLKEFNHEKLEADKKEKEAKNREAALAQQQKLEQVRASLWQKIQDETSADIQASSEYLESAKDLSLAIRIEAEEVLALMTELNITIQATKAYSNDLKQKLTELKKRLYTLIKVEKGTVNENAITTFINPVASVNFKKEILESHATLEESNKARQEKVKVITTEKAEKQRQYQEAQETAAKIESAQKSDSSSSDDDKETALSTQKSIASFKEKRAKQIFHSQDDEFAGNAVRLLNILNDAESFNDIVNQATHGDDLHDLKAEDHKIYGTRYALRVNDQYRITFYWHENKAHQVWFGDYHTK